MVWSDSTTGSSVLGKYGPAQKANSTAQLGIILLNDYKRFGVARKREPQVPKLLSPAVGVFPDETAGQYFHSPRTLVPVQLVEEG